MDEKWFVLLIVTFGLITSLLHHPIIFLLSLTSLTGLKYFLKKFLTSDIVADGKWIFVTGCDSGIGHALVKSLDKRGCYVIAACREEEGTGARSLKESCSNRLTILPLELTSSESIDQCIQTVTKLTESSVLWGVVNNAGMQYVNFAELLTMDMYKRTMDINFFGMVHICKGLIPSLRKSKGRIVNVTSVLGRFSSNLKSPYTASKWAGETFNDLLRREMKRFDIKVCIIEPGCYGSYTNIVSNNEVRIEQNEEMLKYATREVTEAYGGEDIIMDKNKNKHIKKFSKDPLSRVTTQMEHALFNSHPDTRYLIDSPGFDKFCVSRVNVNQKRCFINHGFAATLYKCISKGRKGFSS